MLSPNACTHSLRSLAHLKQGIDLSACYPKPLDDRIVEASNHSITMGCGDVCPRFDQTLCDDWALDDPHGQGLEPIRVIRDELEVHIRQLLLTVVGAADALETRGAGFAVPQDGN